MHDPVARLRGNIAERSGEVRMPPLRIYPHSLRDAAIEDNAGPDILPGRIRRTGRLISPASMQCVNEAKTSVPIHQKHRGNDASLVAFIRVTDEAFNVICLGLVTDEGGAKLTCALHRPVNRP